MVSEDLEYGVLIVWSSFMIFYGACFVFLDISNPSPHSFSLFTLLFSKHSHLICVPHNKELELFELTL